MNRTTKTFRPAFEALEARALLTTGLLASQLGALSKPHLDAAQTAAPTQQTPQTGTENGIIAILIGL